MLGSILGSSYVGKLPHPSEGIQKHGRLTEDFEGVIADLTGSGMEVVQGLPKRDPEFLRTRLQRAPGSPIIILQGVL